MSKEKPPKKLVKRPPAKRKPKGTPKTKNPRSYLHNPTKIKNPVFEGKKLSDREYIFAESYLFSLNKTSAAIDAGCTESNARQSGYEIYNRPHVKGYILQMVGQRVSDVEEIVKIVDDTAKSKLNDYYRPVQIRKTDLIEVGLAEVIKRRREQIALEEEFCDRIGLTEKAYDDFQATLNQERMNIIRMEIELEHNPNATRIIESEPYLATRMQLDINAVVADGEKARIKKYKSTQFGPEIELQDPEAAQEKILKMAGKYAKDNEQKAPVTKIDLDKVSDDVLMALINATTGGKK